VNRLGLTHLSFRVTDVEAVAAKVVELGGTSSHRAGPPSTSVDTTLEFVYCTDP
jgi:hypothetical protein